MEEVVSHRVFAEAVDHLRLPAGQALRVLDLGCGLGDGLALLTQPHGDLTPVIAGRQLEYTGLDADPDMVETAATLHDVPGTTFRAGDMRDDLPPGDIDLYLSCGVPYSHLTPDEMITVLSAMMTRIVDAGRRAVIVVDVLGRYSIEWTPNWDTSRWNYAMTFLEDTSERLEQPMTFYDRPALNSAIAEAAQRAAVPRVDVSFTDRSILVGRHTATRAFNPSIPPYRTLVNDLARGSSTVAPADLAFDPPTVGAPDEILGFFHVLAARWNKLLEEAVPATGEVAGDDPAALAADLLQAEMDEQRGLGTGHSLTATVVVDATAGSAR
nr:class I SAM-dependent methyltransferase [Phytoactinopolyspora mesophila]